MTNDNARNPYLALARKWRPKTFADLQGHELVTKALTNALQSQRLHHAYLFTGTRGVGKTSIARLFAKALNCEHGVSPEPCLVCSTCEAIEQGRLIDLIEIDAASKTRVEDTRDMLDNVQYATSSARFKIYLIDEVHMLSLHSFNALLKTLEEPPAHVKFLLATTDPQKIPVTVLSRCLQFNLRPLSHDIITLQLEKIALAEQLQTEPEALLLIAKAAKGSMRDALSLLDQAIATAGNTLISTALTKTLLGYTQQNYAIPLLEAVLQQDAGQIVTLVQQIVIEGGHFTHVSDEILTTLHTLAVIQQLPDSSTYKNRTPELDRLVQHISPEETHLFYQIALKGAQDMLQAPLLSLGFEMSMMRMLSFRPAVANVSRHSNDTRAPIHGSRRRADAPPHHERDRDASESFSPISEKEVSFATAPLSQGNGEEKIKEPEVADWPTLVKSLRLTGMALSAINNAEFLKKEDCQLILRIQKGHGSLFIPSVKTRIEEAFSQHFQEKISLILQEEAHIQHSIAQKQEETHQTAIRQAEECLTQDPVLQNLQHAFSAEMMKDSIRLLEDEL